MSNCTTRQIHVRKVLDGREKGGWWIVFTGLAAQDALVEYTCGEKHAPFVSKQEAIQAAEWVASHYTQDDGEPVEVFDDETKRVVYPKPSSEGPYCPG